MDSNAVERIIQPIALQRKNTLFAGHDAGAQNLAVIATLIKTCEFNKVEPHSYSIGIFAAIVNGHKQQNIHQLIPWNWAGCRAVTHILETGNDSYRFKASSKAAKEAITLIIA